MKHAERTSDQPQQVDEAPEVIVLDNAAALTQGGSGTSTEDKRYQYG
ncbi:MULTISPECIES: albusnodin family lasso peptide [Streptomyces]|nr:MULTISPECIES: albusnodin family lasso peptide [Streptomyces]MYU53413.1 albusnodin family lasso peptide [Streptomyces sp. SID7805]